MKKYQNLNLPSISRLKIRFSNFSGGINTTIDENLLPLNYAKMSYNLNFQDHSLKTGLGFKELTLPKETQTGERTLGYQSSYGNIDGIWLFKRYSESLQSRVDIIFIHSDTNKLYFQGLYSDYSLFGQIVGFEYVGKPNVLFHKYNNKDVAILTSPSDYLAIWTGSGAPEKINNTLNLTSVCVHYERLFATVSGRKDMVRFSDDFNIQNWDETPEEGGFIQLVDERGTCNKVISFNDYVYIIREHGISRLSAYGDQSQYSVSHLFLCTDKIYENTAILCGDRILMVCSDGLYAFNGYSAQKYDLKINKMFDKSKLHNATACFFNGKYYLSCCLNFFDEKQIGVESSSYTNNALIEFDIKTGKYNIVRGVDIIHLMPIVQDNVHKLAVCFGDSSHRTVVGELTNDGCFFGTPLAKSWVSPMSDFGYPDKIKVVRELHLLTKYDISITISSENQSRTFEIKGSDEIQKICPNVKGKRISISFNSTQANLSISNPNVVVDLV